MRTTIRMNDELARRAKRLAHQNGKTFTQIIEEAVCDLLSKRVHATKPRKLRLPVSGLPNRKLSIEVVKRAMEEAEIEYDLKKIGFRVNAASRR